MVEGGYGQRREQRGEAARVMQRGEGEWSREEPETRVWFRERGLSRERRSREGFTVSRGV
jgi:hypothetical protein